MKNHFRILRHSVTMVGRTLRSYLMLSVTIVLSFTLLLGYLGFVDSEIYNEYKNVFKTNRGYIKVTEGLGGSAQQFSALLDKISEREDTMFYTVYSCYVHMSDGTYVTSAGNTLEARQMKVVFLTGRVWEFYEYFWETYSAVEWLDGQEHAYLDLTQGQAILDTATYYALGLDEMEEPVYTFRFTQGSRILEMTVEIVGLIDLDGDFFLEEDDTGLAYNDSYWPMILLPTDGLSQEALSALRGTRGAIIYSEEPDIIYNLAVDYGFEISLTDSSYRWQDSVLETILAQKQTKALITCAMLLILGINLYSSFSNALNERKFEIGVKRALGASSFAIVRQFLYESILVMVANIAASVVLVLDIGLIYRLIIQNTKGITDPLYQTYTLYVSPYSIGMFFTCAVMLTVVFSLIFAYKSTQVQIIDYLKAE